MKRFIFTILFIIITSLSAWAGELKEVPYPSRLDESGMPAEGAIRHLVYNSRCMFTGLTNEEREQIIADYKEGFRKHHARKQELKTWKYYADGPFLYVRDPNDGKLKNAGAIRAGFGVSIIRHPKVDKYTHTAIIHLVKCKETK